MGKFIKCYREVIVFYVIVALLSLIFTIKINSSNNQVSKGDYNYKVNETEYA